MVSGALSENIIDTYDDREQDDLSLNDKYSNKIL